MNELQKHGHQLEGLGSVVCITYLEAFFRPGVQLALGK
jgi:hypothetical protein